jgi:hypothetical protein
VIHNADLTAYKLCFMDANAVHDRLAITFSQAQASYTITGKQAVCAVLGIEGRISAVWCAADAAPSLSLHQTGLSPSAMHWADLAPFPLRHSQASRGDAC